MECFGLTARSVPLFLCVAASKNSVLSNLQESPVLHCALIWKKTKHSRRYKKKRNQVEFL